MTHPNVKYLKIVSNERFPTWATRDQVAQFFHETMKPYHDSIADVNRALDYAFSKEKGEGGFLMLQQVDGQLAGALLMLNTGMKGYVPENLLLFVTVAPEMRGKGLGAALVKHCIDECDGNVKLHVEYDNPAKRLYERLGFTAKYAEMRYLR
ncbi:GNAT family N-acetyltransferase [bacterium]|nr:GNAT family N-acetyltransferase [bacterium]MBU1983098.1 GNAT family N-acetyltransferase [bacterium]